MFGKHLKKMPNLDFGVQIVKEDFLGKMTAQLSSKELFSQERGEGIACAK